MSRLHVSRFGQASNAPVLVLLHGWGSSSKVWQECIKRLAEDFQIWCIDLPGHGENQSVEWDRTITQGLMLLANALPERCNIVGWSLGGLLAQLYVKHYPHRVQSMMLIASTPKFVASAEWPHAMPSETFLKFSQQFDTSPNATLKQFRVLQTLHSSSSKEVMRVLEQSSPATHQEKIAWGLQWLQEIDLRDARIPKNIPIYLMQGENDQVLSMKAVEQTLELWQSSHRDLQLCKIAEAGHVPFLSHPERFYEQVHLMAKQLT